jgi:4-amino-4-deoxy-L-arabinose transferase-like glycosyltransferase
MTFRDKTEHFLRNKYNLMFLGILLIAFVIRIYYFIYTYNQPLWWDEAEYMSMAKNILYGVPFDFNPQRPILFPLLISLFLWIGEGAVRFFISFVPSLGVVVVTYLLGKEIYNKKIGLIASFIMAVFWVGLFNGTRIHADGMALLFSLLGVYFFWKGYVSGKSLKFTSFGFLFMVLGFMVKVNAVLAPLVVLFFLLITEKLSFLKRKILWKSVIWFFIPLIPYFTYNYFKFGTIFSFIRGYVDSSALTVKFQAAFNWSIFNFTYIFTYKVFFVLFLIGVLFVLMNLILGFDLMYKEKNTEVKADLFSVLSIIVVMGWFIFIERWNAEPRWLILMAPFMFFIIGRGILEIIKYIKFDKKVLFFAIVIILFIGAYAQLNYNHQLIKVKKDSYEPVKLSGLWMKENSNKDDLILSKSVTQTTYYSERKTLGVPINKEEIKELKPKYIVISIYELHTQELLDRIEKIKDHLQIVNGYFQDPEGKQPALIVYGFKDYDF